MTDPTHYGPGEGERIDAGAGSALVLKATGAATGGSFFMSESTIAPGFGGPPPHTHQRLHDMFYVLESGFEHYMRDLGAAAKAGPLTPEVMGPIASRYDFERA